MLYILYYTEIHTFYFRKWSYTVLSPWNNSSALRASYCADIHIFLRCHMTLYCFRALRWLLGTTRLVLRKNIQFFIFSKGLTLFAAPGITTWVCGPRPTQNCVFCALIYFLLSQGCVHKLGSQQQEPITEFLDG